MATPFLKYSVRYMPRAENGFDAVHVLLPLLAQLFLLSFESARVPADWKIAKITLLYKKGPMLDPNSYRMLAVSGTMYRLYANVILSPLTTWCISKSNIPDTQFGFYPGRNTLQTMLILRHLLHAARTIKRSNSSRLHSAFTDFKQAYDTIPRQALQSLCAGDQYLLQDRHKAARVKPIVGVKQGCPLSLLLFLLYIYDIDTNAERVQGAVTGSEDVQVTQMLYADDVTLLANAPDAMQTMLNRLVVCASSKHLTINTAKSLILNQRWSISTQSSNRLYYVSVRTNLCNSIGLELPLGFTPFLLSSNSATLTQALHADLKLVPRAKTSWALDILCAFE